MIEIDKKQLDKTDGILELKETTTCQAKSTFVNDQDSMSNMDFKNLNIVETTLVTGKYFVLNLFKPFKNKAVSYFLINQLTISNNISWFQEK